MKSIFFIILSIFLTYGILPQSLTLDNSKEFLDLNGTWKFSVVTSEITDSDKLIWRDILIPGLWRHQNLSDTTTGLYKNQIYISESWKGKNISILSPFFVDAHEIYFNGTKIGGEGKIDSSGKCIVNNSKSNTFNIPETIIHLNDLNSITVRLCNYAGFAGVFGDFFIGESQVLKEKFYRVMVWNVSIGFVFLFLFAYHLILFSGSKKDLSYLYFSFTCLFAAFLTLCYFRFTYWLLDSFWLHFYLFNSSFGLFPLFLVLFIFSFFEFKIPKWIKFLNILTLFVSITIWLSPFFKSVFIFYSKIGQPFLILAGIPYAISLSIVIFKAIRDKKKGAKIIGTGLALVLLAFFPSILSYFHFIKFINLLPESFLAFVFCIATALSAKFYSVSEQLLSMEKKHSEDLEKKIKDRTRDLEEAKKTAEIETGIAWIAQRESQEEKEKTEKLLKEIQKDMLTAQKIQQNILPQNLEKITKLNIATIYKPVSSVGGDFYDIAEIKPGLVRAFIADATGHGVQAALITMAIKSEYESLKYLLDSPSKILKFLNENFSNKYNSLNIYFTAFIIDININEKKVKFASAGHIPQFLVNENGVQILSHRGNIIGMIPDAEYDEGEHEFSSGRLFLFTDGIEEEFNPEQEQFGEDRVIKILEETRTEKIENSLQGLYSQMTQFIGPTRIRDDITVVGIEYKN